MMKKVLCIDTVYVTLRADAAYSVSVQSFISDRLQEEQVLPSNSISFGQIYGMCDHITFHLGEFVSI